MQHICFRPSGGQWSGDHQDALSRFNTQGEAQVLSSIAGWALASHILLQSACKWRLLSFLPAQRYQSLSLQIIASACHWANCVSKRGYQLCSVLGQDASPAHPGLWWAPRIPAPFEKGLKISAEHLLWSFLLSIFLPVRISLRQKAKWASLKRCLCSGGYTGWLRDTQVVSLMVLIGQNSYCLAHFWGCVLSHSCNPAWCSTGLRVFARAQSRGCTSARPAAGSALPPAPIPGGSSACRRLQGFWAQPSAEHHCAQCPGVHCSVPVSSIN